MPIGFRLFSSSSSQISSAKAHTDSPSDAKNSPFFSSSKRNANNGERVVVEGVVPVVDPSSPPHQLDRQESIGSLAAAALDSLINSVQYDTLKSAFDKFDLNDDGFLSAEEVAAALKQVGVFFTDEQINAFIRLGNVSEERIGAGSLSEDEFLAMVRRHRRMNKMKTRPPWNSDFTEAGGWHNQDNKQPRSHRSSSEVMLRPTTTNGYNKPNIRPTTKVDPVGRRPTSPANNPSPPRRPAVPPAARRGAKTDRTGGPNYQDLHKKATYQSRAAAAGLTASRMAVGVDLEKRLEDVIGLEPIKDKLRSLKDTLVKVSPNTAYSSPPCHLMAIFSVSFPLLLPTYCCSPHRVPNLLQRRFRKEVGAPLVDIGPLHMVFTGNPGCGKTSIARLLAKLLYDLGAVSGPKFIEVQRTDLVGSHIGTTGPKTRAKIDEAKGGILFIDEAYRLTSTSEKDFGTEALEEIMSDMTTGDPLIIAAGYPNDMKRFLDANEGLKRRFGHTFDFPDFSVKEMAQMFIHKATSQGFTLADGVSVDSVAMLIEKQTDPAWRSKTNGGVAEKLARAAMQTQDARLDPTKLGLEAYRAQASTLEMGDVIKAAELFKYA